MVVLCIWISLYSPHFFLRKRNIFYRIIFELQPTEASVAVRKDIYLHVAPPDFDEPAIVPSVVTAPTVNKKHYKIIFIKAPSFKAPAISIPAPAPQDEEKTLVYVLVKKPEVPEPIIQKVAEPKTDKPEVRFNICLDHFFFRNNPNATK